MPVTVPTRIALLLAALSVAGLGPLFAQQVQERPPGHQPSPAKPQSPVERLGPNRLRIGNVQIDTATRELQVNGTVNDVVVLEYLANTEDGIKAYESAFELETNAINMNVALILIGLDPSRSVVPQQKFDPKPPKGDPVEIWVEWDQEGSRRRVRAEEIVYNREAKRTIEKGPWVYTGSTFSEAENTFFAEIDGALIGFTHDPSPLIDNPGPIVGSYGTTIINPALNLKAGTPVTLTIRVVK